MKKIPLNEDEEIRKKIEERENRLENRLAIWKRIKRIGIIAFLILCIFAFIIDLGDPKFLMMLSVTLFLSSFFKDK